MIDKAILLLKRGADISCRGYNGDTVLHTLLKCSRHHEKSSITDLRAFNLSLKEPKELLIVFITAGANVYATNDEDETPSTIAWDYGRDDEWTEALTLCGYDPDEVFAQSDPDLYDCTCERQISKLSLEEYCRQREENARFEEVDTDDEDGDSDGGEDGYGECDHEWTELVAENTEGGDGNTENPHGAESTGRGMDISLESTDGNRGDCFTDEIDNQAGEPDSKENDVEGMDLGFNDSLAHDMDMTDNFFDFDRYLDALL